MPRKTKTHPTMEEIYNRDIYGKEETVTDPTKTTEEKVVENVVENTDRKEIKQFHEEEKSRLEPEFLTVYFEVQTIHPDSREFRQQSIEFTHYQDEICAVLLVGVNVPNIPLYVLNHASDDGIVVFTPAGWFYVQQELERPYLSLVDQSKKPENESASDDGWDETPSTSSATKKSDDDWGDDDTSTSSTKSDKGNEKVNVDEEDW